MIGYTTWTAEGGSKVELYEDINNDLGGLNPYSSDWDCGSNCNGISDPVSLSSSDAYVRIVNGNIEIAIRRSVFNSPEQVRARAWATQTSTLDKSKHFFHDQNSRAPRSGAPSAVVPLQDTARSTAKSDFKPIFSKQVNFYCIS